MSPPEPEDRPRRRPPLRPPIAPEPRAEPEGVVRDTDGRILRGPALPCGCPLDAECTGYHPGALP